MVYVIEVEHWNGYKQRQYAQIPDAAEDVEAACQAYIEGENAKCKKKGLAETNFVRVIGKAPFKGIDGYGQYSDFTGYEASHRCFWCGAEIRRGRYCCPDHRDEYLSHYKWPFARDRCIEASVVKKEAVSYRDRTAVYLTVRCSDCGVEKEYDSREFEVHHIVPMDGEDRNWHWLNRHENLVLLCRKCHVQRHVELNNLLRKAESVGQRQESQFEKEEDRQLELRW